MLKSALTRLLAAGALALAIPAQAELVHVADFGANPGALDMYKYVPAQLPEKAPLIVALHGCTQSPSDYDDEPGWLEIAERFQAAVVFPKQNSTNQEYLCFNWFDRANQQRDKGEPASIVAMVDKMIADHGLDGSRVYAAGLSGGASMVAVLMATYPDRFAGGAIIGGVPYGCAADMWDLASCMGGTKKSAEAWGKLVRKAAKAERYPRVSIWHGYVDSVVDYKNAAELVKQWTHVHGIDATETGSETVAGHTRAIYGPAAAPVVELWTLKGLDHGSPIAPGDGPQQCGRKASWALDAGICAAHHIALFWGLQPAP